MNNKTYKKKMDDLIKSILDTSKNLRKNEHINIGKGKRIYLGSGNFVCIYINNGLEITKDNMGQYNITFEKLFNWKEVVNTLEVFRIQLEENLKDIEEKAQDIEKKEYERLKKKFEK